MRDDPPQRQDGRSHVLREGDVLEKGRACLELGPGLRSRVSHAWKGQLCCGQSEKWPKKDSPGPRAAWTLLRSLMLDPLWPVFSSGRLDPGRTRTQTVGVCAVDSASTEPTGSRRLWDLSMGSSRKC